MSMNSRVDQFRCEFSIIFFEISGELGLVAEVVKRAHDTCRQDRFPPQFSLFFNFVFFTFNARECFSVSLVQPSRQC
jgi:hypothetical protein